MLPARKAGRLGPWPGRAVPESSPAVLVTLASSALTGDYPPFMKNFLRLSMKFTGASLRDDRDMSPGRIQVGF